MRRLLPTSRTGWRELLTAHREQLREWAENYPPTFADKHALVSAEIARLEGRAVDAMQLYEQAIQSARENGFVQNEGWPMRWPRGSTRRAASRAIAHAYLRNARNCYDRWGALGKVRQLDATLPALARGTTPAFFAATIGTPVGQLDVATVVKASQALSSEMVLNRLIEKLMRIALEHAGAERGLLILLRGDDEPRIEAEATTGHGRVEVTVRQAAVTPSDLPQSALHYVIRTRERVVLDDASAGNLYSEDEYVRQKRPRSVLCLPIVKQTQACRRAVSREQSDSARLHAGPGRSAGVAGFASRDFAGERPPLFRSAAQRSFPGSRAEHKPTGSFGWNVSSGEIYWSEETYNIFEYDRTVKPRWTMYFSEFIPTIEIMCGRLSTTRRTKRQILISSIVC